MIVAAPHHPLAALPLVSREQLAATPFLGLTVGAHTIEFADEGLQAVGLRRNVVQRLPFQDAVKRLVEAGRGISMMARIAAEREIAAGHLTTLNVEGFALKYTLLLLRPAGQPHAPAVETFAAFFRQHPRLRAPLNP